MTPDIIQRRIRDRLNELGINYTQLASALGKSYKTVTKWVYGAAYPRTADIPRLCSVLHCSPNYLFGWEENDSHGNIKKDNQGSAG